MTGQTPKLRVLLIMRDAPDTEAHKGGLFPTAIRHHVDLGFDVHVASITPMEPYHENVVRALGAQPYSPPATMLQRLGAGGLLARLKDRGGPEADLTTQKAIADIGRTMAPDVVVGLQSYPTGLIARDIARALGVTYMTWEHVSTYHTGRALSVPDAKAVALFKESHAVLTVSSRLRESICQRFSISLDNAHRLPNPIPSGFLDPPNTAVPDWLAQVPASDFVFASWTSWRAIKRLDLLLDAFAQVWRARPEARLIIAGVMKGDTPELTAAFLERNPDVAERIIFTGDVDRASVRHLAEGAQCSVISSAFETFGLQMVEAIALGTPVVSTRCGGPEDVLSDRRLGVLCDSDDVDGLSAAMLDVMENYAAFDPAQIARIANDLLGDDAIRGRWARVYEGIRPEGAGSA